MPEYVIDFNGDLGPRYAAYEIEGKSRRCLTVPWNQKQIRYFDSKTPNVLFGGGRGPGKTESICWDALFKGYLCPGSRQIIFRRVMGELKKTIIDRFKQMPKGLRGRYIGEEGNQRVELPNGSIIYFSAARTDEAIRKTLSGEYLCVHFDEWSEWPYAQWKFIAGSKRTTIERNIFGEPVVAQVKGATNPGGEGGGDLNRLFGCDVGKCAAIGEDEDSYRPDDYEFIKTLLDDNPAYAEGTPQGDAYRKELESQPRAVKDAWLYGIWSGFEGQYFVDAYEYPKCSIPYDKILKLMRQQYWQPCWIGLDQGRVHHSYVGWHTFLEIYGHLFIVTYRDLFIKGISETALVQEVVEMTPEPERKRIDKIYGSPELGFDSRLQRGRRMGDIFVANGMVRMTSAYNERADGFSLMYNLLKEDNHVEPAWAELPPKEDGTPSGFSGWLISDDLEVPFEALPWAMASKKPGEEGDIDGRGDNPLLDVLDGLRYGIASRRFLEPGEKPQKQKLNEKLAAMPVEGSGRYIEWLKSKKAEHQEGRPFYLSRGRWGGRRH